jgi:hypothetical protein
MTVSVCPIAIVAAPLEQVWALLANPSSYALWWDAQTDVIVPEGPTRAGQTVSAPQQLWADAGRSPPSSSSSTWRDTTPS